MIVGMLSSLEGTWASSLACEFLSHDFFSHDSNASARHNVIQNVSGIPGGQYRRQPTQQLAQVAYEEALDNGQVVRVTYELSKETLSR
jgi:hypothetical protein